SYFLWTVCALAVLLFGATAATGSIAQALEAAITLLIVTCPCALALATPLTFTRALNLAARHGMVVKNDAVLERVSKIKKVFFDKTGTLTHGQLSITDMRELATPMLPLADVVLSLEVQGKHPMARALSEWARAQGATVHTVTDWEEVPGLGVRGGIAGLPYRISRYEVWENDRLVATFAASDRLRREAPAVIDSFRRQGLALELLSGDAPDVAHAVASGAGLRASEVKAKLTPEEKSRILESETHAMMVGDGANDAIALTRADVGVAVWGATDISLRAADVYLLTPGLEALPTLLTLGTETMRVIRRNLIISLSYNVVSVLFVFAGAITPLVAAIIMPVSSLSVLVSTFIGTKTQRHLWK
ncbi:MAG: heavy metal translocating P-type ATPase, partial [Bacteriovoracia bacterium]